MIRDKHWVVVTVVTVATVAMDVYRVLMFCHPTIYFYVKGSKKGFAGIVMIVDTFLRILHSMHPMQRNATPTRLLLQETTRPLGRFAFVGVF